MKRLAALLASVGASLASAAHFSSAADRFDCPATGNSRACAASIDSSLGAAFLTRPTRGRLDVKLLDGRVHSFVDVDVDGSTALYHHALEVSGTGRYVVIHRQFYEGSGFGILDRQSGTFTRFPGYPLLSPDEHWVAVVGGHESADPVFTILQARQDEFLMVTSLRPKGWWPTAVKWESPASIAYARTALAEAGGGERTMAPARLQLVAGVWR